jgi:hypothetical protein
MGLRRFCQMRLETKSCKVSGVSQVCRVLRFRVAKKAGFLSESKLSLRRVARGSAWTPARSSSRASVYQPYTRFNLAMQALIRNVRFRRYQINTGLDPTP